MNLDNAFETYFAKTHPTNQLYSTEAAMLKGEYRAVWDAALEYFLQNKTFDKEEPSSLRGEAREKYIHDHDCPKAWEFYKRYAVGSKLCPSCLLCGKQAFDPADWSIRHADLPDIYICKTCVDAARSNLSARGELLKEASACLRLALDNSGDMYEGSVGWGRCEKCIKAITKYVGEKS